MAAAPSPEPINDVLARMSRLENLTTGINSKIGDINAGIQNQIVNRIQTITGVLQTIKAAIERIATTRSDAVEALETQIRGVDADQRRVIDTVISSLDSIDIRPIMAELDLLETELRQISSSLSSSGGPGSGPTRGGYTYGKNRRRRRRGKKSKKKKGSSYKMKGKN